MCSNKMVEAEKAGGSASSQYNLGNLVELVHRLNNLLWPVLVFYHIAVFIVRWESPIVTSCVWFVTVIVTYYMEAGHVIFFSFMALASVAGCGHLIRQSKTQPLEKKPNASTGNTGTTPAQRAGLSRDVEIDRRHKLLEEFRHFMVGSQEVLLKLCSAGETIEAVLTWCHQWSLIFYTSSFVVLVVCSTLPFRWFVILLTSCVFIVNHEAFSNLSLMQGKLISQDSSKIDESIKSGEKEAEKKEEKTPPPQSSSKEEVKHPEIRIDGASTQTPTPNTPSTENSPEDEDKPPKVVSRVRERSATAPTDSPVRSHDKLTESGDHASPGSSGGQCSQCGVAFTSVLKRRKYCRHCGNDFCSKCCKHKLPRAAFGATAPAAQTEKELVCNACFLQLTAEESGTTDKG